MLKNREYVNQAMRMIRHMFQKEKRDLVLKAPDSRKKLLLFGVLFMLLMAFQTFPAAAETMLSAGEVYGSVVELTDDTILLMDTELTLEYIKGAGKTLTVAGPEKLTITGGNAEDACIRVGNFQFDGSELDISDCKASGIYADGGIGIRGAVVTMNIPRCTDYGMYAPNGGISIDDSSSVKITTGGKLQAINALENVFIMGTVDITASGRPEGLIKSEYVEIKGAVNIHFTGFTGSSSDKTYGIYATRQSVIVDQPGSLTITADAASPSGDIWGVYTAADVVVEGTADISFPGYAINAENGIRISGTVQAVNSKSGGRYSMHSSGGTFTINDGGTYTRKGSTGANGIYIETQDGENIISGNVVVFGNPDYPAIYAEKSNVKITSSATVTAESGRSGIRAKTITISGGTVYTSGNRNGLRPIDKITISGETTKVTAIATDETYSEGAGIFAPNGIFIDVPLDVTTPSPYSWEETKHQYVRDSNGNRARTVVIEDTRASITIRAADKSVTYDPDGIDIPVNGMFIIPDEAGTPGYNVIFDGDGTGSYNQETSILQVTKAGTFTVKVTTEPTEDHKAGSASAVLTVTKASPAFTVSLDGWTYGETPKDPSAMGTTGNGAVTYTYYTDAACSSKTNTDHGAAAAGGRPAKTGTYYVKGSVTETDVYEAFEADAVSFTITPRTVTVTSGITAAEKPYDGKTDATLVCTAAVLEGVVSGENVTVSGTGTFSDANAGENKTVTISSLELGGTDSGNYVLAQTGNQESTTGTITRKELTITTGITADNKEYDGTTDADLITNNAQVIGLVEGESVTFTVSGAFGDANVGNNKTVTLSGWELTSGSNNYVLASSGNQVSTTANITAAKVYIAGITSKDKVYDGNTDASVTGTAVLKKTSGDSTPAGLTVSNITAEFSDKNAGSGKSVSITGGTLSDASNYSLDISKTNTGLDLKADITPKSVSVTGVTGANREYKSDILTVLLKNGTVNNVVSGDTVTVDLTNAVGTMSDADAGDDKPVTVTGVELGGIDASNYQLSGQPTGVTVNIGKAGNPVQIEETAIVKKGGNTVDLLSENVSKAEGTVTFSLTSSEADAQVGEKTGIFTSGEKTGDFTVKVTAAGNKNYLSGSGLIKVTVTEKDTAELTNVAQADTIYGSELPAVTYDKPADSGTETVLYSGTVWDGSSYGLAADPPTQAGSYTAAVTYETSDTVYTGSALFAIKPRSIAGAVVTLDPASLEYNGTKQTVSIAAVVLDDKPLSEGDYGPAAEAQLSGENADIYTVTVNGKGNYTGEKSGTFTITKATPVIETPPAAGDIIYGQTLKDSTLSGGTAKLGTNEVTGSFTWKTPDTAPAVEDSGVTEYTVVFTPNDTVNYNPVECKVTLNVDPAIPGVTPPAAVQALTYSGKKQKLVSGGSAENGTVLYSLDGENFSEDIPEGTNAGTYKVSWFVKGDENYDDSEVKTLELTIAQKAVTVTADDLGKTEGEKDPELTATVSGTIGSDTVTYDISRETGEKPGSYTITVSGEASQGNYSVAFDPGTFTITAKDDPGKDPASILTKPKGADGLTETGDKQKLLTQAGKAKGGTVLYSIDGGKTYSDKIPTAAKAGTYTVSWYVKGDKNHSSLGSAKKPYGTITVTIAEKKPEITVITIGISHIKCNGGKGIPDDVKHSVAQMKIRITDKNQTYESEKFGLDITPGAKKNSLDVSFKGKLPKLSSSQKITLVDLPKKAGKYSLSGQAWVNKQGEITVNVIWTSGDLCGTEQIAVYPLPEDEYGAYALRSDGTKEYLLFPTYDICVYFLADEELCRGNERCYHKESWLGDKESVPWTDPPR